MLVIFKVEFGFVSMGYFGKYWVGVTLQGYLIS